MFKRATILWDRTIIIKKVIEAGGEGHGGVKGNIMCREEIRRRFKGNSISRNGEEVNRSESLGVISFNMPSACEIREVAVGISNGLI